MVLNNFRVKVSIYVVCLILLAGALMYSLLIAHWLITSVVLIIAIAVLVFKLILFLENTNKEFTTFLLSIKNADFSEYSINDKRGKSFKDLKEAMNIILKEFHRARIEKEGHFIYLQTAVEHMNTAIISFDEDGTIKLINQAAKTLFNTPYLQNIYSLRSVNDKLCDFLTTNNRSSNLPLEININGEQLTLSARASVFSIQGIEHRLISIQNIRTEIENTEIEAWEQLLRVLTHEIMNSMTPLSSLSATLKTKADSLVEGQSFDKEIMDDLCAGLGVIAKRSNGLINFVHHYRSITTLPEPDLKVLESRELIERAIRLKKQELDERGIQLKFHTGSSLIWIKADPGQIEQVMINLLNNAIDALEQHPDPLLEIISETADNKTTIQVIDNGQGIEMDNLDKIFIPFFSTKNQGTGIGLSLSKQIMRMHGGSIKVSSTAGKRTIFSLEFPGVQ
ncbi:MAG: hypothetical protein JWQ38_1056 [Flavipsychrobacter sp.]|nr:hypothetical protein [Flavipsychrobacter sp.]